MSTKRDKQAVTFTRAELEQLAVRLGLADPDRRGKPSPNDYSSDELKELILPTPPETGPARFMVEQTSDGIGYWQIHDTRSGKTFGRFGSAATAAHEAREYEAHATK